MDKQKLFFGAEEEGINRRVTHSAHMTNLHFAYLEINWIAYINADMWKYVYLIDR